MGGHCCLFFAAFLIILIHYSQAETGSAHKLVKRQNRGPPSRAFPLSRSRQFPPPEELEVNGEDSADIDYETLAKRPRFRGQQVPPSEESPEEYSYTEAPPTTTVPSTKPPNRVSAFNRFPNRPRFGTNVQQSTSSSTTSTSTSTVTSRFRPRFSPSATQRIDIAAEILDRPPPPRPQQRNISLPKATTSEESQAKKPPSSETNRGEGRRIANGRTRPRGRFRARTSTTTTTTTTSTPAPEEYYYYYYDEEEAQPIATTISTTTTTTTTSRPPSLPRRPSLNRRPSNSRTTTTKRPVVKFDPDAFQFQPPPEDAPATLATPSTKRFTTSTTEAPGPGGIPAHLKGKYKPRSDGRFIDYLRDPNRPRELKGFDLTDYPFYVKVPEDIDFNCEDMKDGYYASVPHHCQLFHYCFAGARYDFLCANYTLYDQTTFTCRFANNVDCPSSEKYYYRNDDLWKETTTMPPEEQKKKKPSKVEDDDEEYYDDDDYYDDEEEEERRRPPKRRRNRRRRKNRRRSSLSE